MCYSAKLSLLSFSVGFTASITLIIYGNKENSNINKVIGLYILYVSIMQLIEYMIWKDLDCNKGFNKIASLLGQLINHTQPIILIILLYLYMEPNLPINKGIVIMLNSIYLGYVLNKYNTNNLCTKINKHGHLDWNWKYNFNYNYYHLILLFNYIIFYKNINLSTTLFISYVLFYYFKLKKINVSELWCFSVTGVPFVNLFMQKVLNINN